MDLVTHKRARFDFEVLETVEAGIELLGTEVKSLRARHGKLEGAHIIVRGGEAFLVGAHIPAFQPKNTKPSFDPDRTRKLLLSREQVHELLNKNEARGLTLVPLSLYSKKRYIKVAVAVARGKKKADKREQIKERDVKREINRELKRQYQ
jgi:SsrA-binding protein